MADEMNDWRIGALLAEFSQLGAKHGSGLERLAFGEADAAARSELARHFELAGFHVRCDAIGNLFGFVLPPEGDEPLVLVGSHLDSQPDGGRFDGQIGVLAGLLVAIRLKRAGLIPAGVNLGVVNWANEEGARFQPSVMGSSVYTGQLPLETALAAADIWGISVGEELSRLRLSDSSWVGRPPAAYAELHVEQGARLESDGIEIGVVEGTWAAYKADIAVHGVQTHTGPTPMAQRVDALYAAAKVIAAVREIALAEPNDRLHTSVAWMRVTPNSPNATPSLVELKVELRSRSAEVLSAARGSLERVVNETAEATAAQIVVGPWSERETRDFDPELVERVVAGVEQAGLSCRRMLTIAGHDAVVMNAVGVPTVLLFIPSHDGITHNAEEFTSEVDLENGVIALGEAVALLCHDVAVGTTR